MLAAPAWLKLLRHQQRRHRLALTLPFLVGALRKPIGSAFSDEQDGLTALRYLLSCFRDETEEPYVVRLFLCPDLKQPVASIQQIYWHPNYVRWGMEKPNWRPLDIQAPYQPKDQDDTFDAALILWPQISTAITSGEFSYSRSAKRYLKFDDNDHLFVTEALTYDEDNQL